MKGKDMENLQVTSLEQLKQVKQTDIVNLGKFEDGTEFIAELKRPDMLAFITEGKIPNTLLQEAAEVFNGKTETMNKATIDGDVTALQQLGELLEFLCEETLVNPSYKEIKEIGISLPLEMRTTILTYVQAGIDGLKSFRKEQERIENNKSVREI